VGEECAAAVIPPAPAAEEAPCAGAVASLANEEGESLRAQCAAAEAGAVTPLVVVEVTRAFEEQEAPKVLLAAEEDGKKGGALPLVAAAKGPATTRAAAAASVERVTAEVDEVAEGPLARCAAAAVLTALPLAIAAAPLADDEAQMLQEEEELSDLLVAEEAGKAAEARPLVAAATGPATSQAPLEVLLDPRAVEEVAEGPRAHRAAVTVHTAPPLADAAAPLADVEEVELQGPLAVGGAALRGAAAPPQVAMQVAEAFPLSDILSVLEGADWREWSLEDVGTHLEQCLHLKVGSLSASYVDHAGRIRADAERTCNALTRTPLGAAAMQRDGSAARRGEQDGGGPAPAARGGQRAAAGPGGGGCRVA
jgi:hypothetical protein